MPALEFYSHIHTPLSSQACEKKKRAKKIRAEAKFGKGKGKGSKGRGKGRGRGRGAKGRGRSNSTTPVEPEVADGEPPLVRRRLSFNTSHLDEGAASSLEQAEDPAAPDPAGDVASELGDEDPGDVPGDDVAGDLGDGDGDGCMELEVEPSKSPLSVKENNSDASEGERESKLVMADTLDIIDAPNVAEPASSSTAAPAVVETAVVAPSICGSGPARPKIHHTPPALAAAAPPGCSLILNCNLAPIPMSVFINLLCFFCALICDWLMCWFAWTQDK